MYKSTDDGKTWTHIGLETTEHIGRIAVDPTNPERVFVAALGHVRLRILTGGFIARRTAARTGRRFSFKASDPDNVGAIDVAIDPKNPRVVYARCGLRGGRPGRSMRLRTCRGAGCTSRSTAGTRGSSFRVACRTMSLSGRSESRCRRAIRSGFRAVVDDIGAAVARPMAGGGAAANAPEPKTSGGVYLSDDAGATWRVVNSETRLWGRGWYFESVTVDPVNPDKAYLINTATYLTTDAGKTFVPVKGAPGGDDYHQIWVNPHDPNRMVLSSDQGTVVSVDGAKSWSTWYNQPTAEIYHVAADNRFPYWLYRGAAGQRRRRGEHVVARGSAFFPQLGADLPCG